MTTRSRRDQPIARGRRKTAGFTLIEMLAVMALIGVLTGIVMPKLWAILEEVKVTQAIADISAIQIDLVAFSAAADSLPTDLNAIGRASMLDPWGHPYVYFPYSLAGKNNQGARKDRSQHPLNSDFDLYSMGKDGASNLAITAHASQDDIIRANDGGFIGLARNY